MKRIPNLSFGSIRLAVIMFCFGTFLIPVNANTATTAVSTLTPATSPTQTGILYLSGHGSDDAIPWEFQVTEGRRAGEKTTIPVPSCWELQGFGTYQYGMPFYGKADAPGIAKEQGLYKTTFKLPAAWEGRTIRLVFEGVMTDCSANINGRRAVKLHQGGFYRFKADVSDRVFFGEKENVLEVTVSKESANPSVNMAERRADYWNFGGIFRPVFIEALPALNIERTGIDAKGDGTFTAEVFLGSAQEKGATVQAQLLRMDGSPVGKAVEAEVRPGSDRALVSHRYESVRSWSAEKPNRYQMKFTLVQDGKIRHEVTETFGFRTIEVRPSDGLYLNGSKLLVKGVNRHSFRPETGRTLSYRANLEDVQLMRSMNMNAVRLSHYPSDPEFLDICDSLGLYVMVELASWHKHYDTEVGRSLVREMIVRDVNHPSVIWWSNGNEQGWNTELDAEFAPWDPQKRPVIHPQGNFGGFETMHYRSYGESQEYMRKPEIFMPTEFLHGLYDGGHGAGLYDYWELMRNHPRCAGGFLWVLADEGVARTDQNNRIDNCGNYGADGIVGPHHEKEGSYYTIQELWSPVQIENTFSGKKLPADFDATLKLRNAWDFNNLKDCRFEWKLVNFNQPTDAQAGCSVKASGKMLGPDVAARQNGVLKLNLPGNWKNYDALTLTAYGPETEELRSWVWWIREPQLPVLTASSGTSTPAVTSASATNPKTSISKASAEIKAPTLEKTEALWTVTAGSLKLNFDPKTGLLTGLERSGKTLSLKNGPRFIAARRGDRSMDVYYNHDDEKAKSKERIYTDISGTSTLKQFTSEEAGSTLVLKASYFGNLVQTTWTIDARGSARVDYEYRYDGVVELMGVCFDYPEQNMLSKRWLGDGPYRVWQNRLHGPTLGVWENDYNDPIPAETFNYPEFKGYFSGWRWVKFGTTEGGFTMFNGKPGNYLGVYTPRDGRDNLLYTIPASGIAVLDVIPAVRNKVNSTDLNGPSAQAKWANGLQQGSILFQF